MFESANHFVSSEALIGFCKWKEKSSDFQFWKYLRARCLTISKSSNQNKNKLTLKSPWRRLWTIMIALGRHHNNSLAQLIDGRARQRSDPWMNWILVRQRNRRDPSAQVHFKVSAQRRIKNNLRLCSLDNRFSRRVHNEHIFKWKRKTR